MALMNRRQRNKKIEPTGIPDATATPAEPTPAAEPAERNQVHQPDEETVVTELEPTPGPGTGGRGRPPKKQPASFFDRLNDYPSSQWDGGQIVLSLYRLEPYTDRTTGGPKPVWVMKYGGPIDQERILLDHGSGRYRLYLNQAEPGRRKTVLVETHEFEIFNPKYPPKIPPGEWVEDPRNRKWAWAHPSRQRQDGPLGVSDVLELVREAIRTERPEIPPHGAETTDAAVKLAIEQSKGRDALAKELAGRVPQAIDPVAALDKAVDLLKKLQLGDGKADPLAALDHAIELVRKLLPPQPAPAPAPADLLSEIDRLSSLFEKFKPIFAPEVPEAPPRPSTHTRMAGWQEFLAPVLPELLKSVSPLFQGLGQMMVMKAAQGGPQNVPMVTPAPPGATPGAPQAQSGMAQPDGTSGQPPQPVPQNLIGLVNAITPVMLRWMGSDSPGEELGRDLAEYCWENFGLEDLNSLQQLGADAIFDLYRQTPAWMILAPMAVKFRALLEGFVVWKPSAEDDGQPETFRDASTTEPIDLDVKDGS